MQVRAWCHDVIAWLAHVKPEDLASSASQGSCRQLSCFAAWVRLGAVFEADQSQIHRLVQLAFHLTTSQDEGMRFTQTAIA